MVVCVLRIPTNPPQEGTPTTVPSFLALKFSMNASPSVPLFSFETTTQFQLEVLRRFRTGTMLVSTFCATICRSSLSIMKYSVHPPLLRLTSMMSPCLYRNARQNLSNSPMPPSPIAVICMYPSFPSLAFKTWSIFDLSHLAYRSELSLRIGSTSYVLDPVFDGLSFTVILTFCPPVT